MSQIVLYTYCILSGIFLMFCTLPLFAIIWFFISDVQRLRFIKSLTKCLLTQINSPERTRLEYILEVKGSNDSLLPRI